MNGKKFVNKLLICKVGSVHLWHRIHPKKYGSCKKSSKVSMRSKVNGFYGMLSPEYRDLEFWMHHDRFEL